MVDVQRSSLVHPGHYLVVCAVEAVHPDHTGFRLHVSVVRVGGVQVVLEHRQPVQVLDLTGGGVGDHTVRQKPLLPYFFFSS